MVHALLRNALLVWLPLCWTTSLRAQPTFIAHLPGQGFDGVSDITVMADGSLVVCGAFSETIDLDPSAGTTSITAPPGGSGGFVARYDAVGALLWGAALVGSDVVNARAVAVDENGHVHVVGHFAGSMDADPGPGVSNLTSMDDWDVFWLRLDVTGNLVWAGQLGGTGRQFPYQAEVDLNGSLYLSGNNFDTMDADPGSGVTTLANGAWIGRFALGGTPQWVHRLPSLELYFGVDAASGRVYTGGGSEVVTPGTYDFDPGSGTLDPLAGALPATDVMAFLAFDTNGDLVAHHFVRGDADFQGWDNRPRRMVVDANGDVYACGSFISDFGAYPGNSVTLDAPSTGTDGFLLKFDLDLQLLWEKRFGAPIANEGCSDVVVDDQGRVWLGGTYGDGAELNSAGPSVTVNSAGGTTDAYIVAFSLDGTHMWHGTYGGADVLTDGPPYLVHHGGQLCFGSYFRSTADLDVTVTSATYTSAASSDSFLSCMDVMGLPTPVNAADREAMGLQLRPNPARDEVTMSGMRTNTAVEILNAQGQRMLITRSSTIDVSAWSNGLYFVKAGSHTQRLIIQH